MINEENCVVINGRTFKPFIDEATIAVTVDAIAGRINRDYAGKEPLFLITLKGAIFFGADLLRKIDLDCQVETISASSYGTAMESSGSVDFGPGAPDVAGRDVIIVEDIVDTGRTMKALREKLARLGPASVAAAALLSKTEKRKVEVELEYIGVEIPPLFVVGYGLDYDEKGRRYPSIYVLSEGEE